MGISGLLPLLKSIQKHTSLKQFTGQVIGIDAYGWLHRGTVACAIELALGKPTTKYVDFAVNRVRMLLDFGITPYVVFDGGSLPSKAGTNAERRRTRDESKAIGLELYKAGKISQAHQELQKAADVTPYMARELIEELKRMNVQYVVAPYEADAQLVYLERKGIINAILSEDSDLLVFGANCLLTKLNQYGECIEINRVDFASCREVSLVGWTDTMFRRMAILSGCDYLPNISKLGLKTAYRYVRKYKDPEKVLRMIQFEGQFCMPPEYPQQFKNAELTFLHHRVFCPIEKKLVHLTELSPGMKAADLPFLGEGMDPDTAIGVACGDLNAKTKEPITVKASTRSSRPPLREQRRQTMGSTVELKHEKSIDNFFKPRREPLAELDPNSLTPSPSQQRLLRTYQNASWDMRTVSSAPQLRRTNTGLTPIGGTSHASRPTDRAAFLARAATVSVYQPPKRQRLCSEMESPSPSKEVKKSPFFTTKSVNLSPLAQKTTRAKKARKSDFEVWSDDSVDEILLGLPDVHQVVSPKKDSSDTETAPLKGSDSSFETVPQSSPPKGISPCANSSDVQTAGLVNSDRPSQVHISQLTMDSTGGERPDSAEAFEHLLDAHEAGQRSSIARTFVCQSPPQRAVALGSLSSGDSSQEAGVAREDPSNAKVLDSPPIVGKLNFQKTFSYQSSSQQAAALHTLGKMQNESWKAQIGLAALAALSGSQESCQPTSSLQRLGQRALARTQQSTKATTSTTVRTVPAQTELSVTTTVLDESLASKAAPKLSVRGSEDHIVPDTEDELSATETSPEQPRIDLKTYVYTRA